MADERLSILITANTAGFTKAMANVQAKMRAMSNNVDRDLIRARSSFRSASMDISKSVNGMRNHIGRAMSNVGSIMKASIVGIAPAIVPVLATATAGVLALGSSFASAGIGAVAFGAVAVGVLKDVFTASEELAKANKALDNAKTAEERAKALEMQKEALAGLSSEQQKALKALDSFKSFWGEFTKQFEKPIVAGFITSLDIAKGVLDKLAPTISNVADVANEMLSGLDKSLNSGGAKQFFDWLENNASESLRSFSIIFGNTFKGIFGLLQAFAPMGASVEEGLIKMTARFAEWSMQLENSKGFQKFVDYVKQNTPVVLSVIGNLVRIFVNLGKELAPFGAKVLSGLNTAFKFLADNMNVIVPIAGAVLGGFMAFKAVMAIVGVIGAVINGFKFLMTAMKMAKIAFIVMRAVMMANPFIAIATAVVVVATLIITNWDKIKFYLVKTWSWIKSTAVKVWDGLKAYFSFVLKVYLTLFTNIWQLIKNTISVVWSGIKSVISSGTNIVKSLISTGFNFVRNTISNLMNSARTIVSNIWNSIKTLFSTGVLNVVNKVIGFKTSIVNKFQEIKSSVVDKIRTMTSDMKTKFTTGVDDLVKKAKSIPSKIGSAISGAVGDAVKGVKELGSKIIDTFKEKLGIHSPSRVFTTMGKYVVEGLKNGLTWDNIKKFATNVFSGVTDGALGAWNTISDLFSGQSLSGVKSFFGGFASMAKGAMGNIKDFFKVGNKASGSGVNQWRGLATQALMMTGQFSQANLERLLYQMQTESGGNARAINNWDINAKRGTPSKGLMQVIDPTFRAYAMPGYNKNIYDPLSNMLASIRYAVARYGSLGNAYRGVGYATGGIFNGSKDGVMAKIAEGHGNEAVVPLSNKTKMKPFAHSVASMMPKEKAQVVAEGGTYEFIIPVEIDGREVARATAKFTKEELEKIEKQQNRMRGL